ncbi:hypothetical protein ACVTNA_27850, partial [Escherichia coli]
MLTSITDHDSVLILLSYIIGADAPARQRVLHADSVKTISLNPSNWGEATASTKVKCHSRYSNESGFAPIFPDTCYHLTHYWPAAADIPVASDNPVH